MRAKPGRPKISIQQLDAWTEALEPFLKKGLSLYSAIERAGLVKHKDSIYRNLRLNQEFCEKIHYFQSYPGEIVNNIYARIIEQAHAKLVNGESITAQEIRIICHYATHHRGCEQFFIQSRPSIKKQPPKPQQPIQILYYVPKMEEDSPH